MANYQSLDHRPPLRLHGRRRPASATRTTMEVAKLIDVSRCIGCKACQSACEEWNDLRDEIGHNDRRVREPARSDARNPGR